jgi:hypothetical protein
MHALRFEPSGGWLASHSCEAGLSQGHPHIARYHTTTYQQLPTSHAEGETPPPRSTSFRRAGFAHKVEAARRVRGSDAFRSRVQTERCSQQHYHPIPHLQACS